MAFGLKTDVYLKRLQEATLPPQTSIDTENRETVTFYGVKEVFSERVDGPILSLRFKVESVFLHF